MKKNKGLKRFLRNKPAVMATLFLFLVSFSAIFAPFIAPYSFEDQNLEARLERPNALHWMGTDPLGRDLYSRIIYGARTSMTVGIVTAFISLVLGTLFGAISGFLGGWVDSILMRIVDMVYIFPSLLLAILIMVMIGQGLFGILLALGAVGWVQQARLVRGQVLQIKEQLHVEAARSLGMSRTRMLARHILPLLWGPVMVSLTFQIPTNIMAESFLSFIGLGLQPPHSSWGTLANEGWRAMQSYPHLILFPGLALFFTMLAFQFLGDGLRDWLDPKLK